MPANFFFRSIVIKNNIFFLHRLLLFVCVLFTHSRSFGVKWRHSNTLGIISIISYKNFSQNILTCNDCCRKHQKHLFRKLKNAQKYLIYFLCSNRILFIKKRMWTNFEITQVYIFVKIFRKIDYFSSNKEIHSH